MQLYASSALLLGIRFMVKHVEPSSALMSNGLGNETHLHLDTKRPYPQALLPKLCLEVEKAELSTSGVVCRGWSGLFCTLWSALPSLPQPLHPEWMSFWRTHVGARNKSFVSPEGNAEGCPSGESHTSAVSCSISPTTHCWWSHPHLRRRSKRIRGYALKRALYTHWKTSKTGEKPKGNGVTDDTAAKKTGPS